MFTAILVIVALMFFGFLGVLIWAFVGSQSDIKKAENDLKEKQANLKAAQDKVAALPKLKDQYYRGPNGGRYRYDKNGRKRYD